jgi:hypothetical protein
MDKRQAAFRRSQLIRAAKLLIKGETVRAVAKECADHNPEFPLSTGTVGRLRQHLADFSSTGHPESLSVYPSWVHVPDFMWIYLARTERRSRRFPGTAMPRRRGRPPKPAAKLVKGVWQKAWASAGGLGMRQVAAAANGSPIGRKPYVVRLAGPSTLEAHSPGGRRAYLYVAEKPLRPMTLAKALTELRELTGPGLRVYHYDQSLFRSPRMRARLGEATFVTLAIPAAMTGVVKRVVKLTAPAPRRPKRKPPTPRVETREMQPITVPLVPRAPMATDWL